MPNNMPAVFQIDTTNMQIIDVATGEPITGTRVLPSGKIMYSDGTIPLQGNGVPTLKELENATTISLPDPDINSIVDKLRIQGYEQTANGLRYVSNKLNFKVDITLYFNPNSIAHKIAWEHPTYTLNMETGDIEYQGLNQEFKLVWGNNLYKEAIAIAADLISRSPFWTN